MGSVIRPATANICMQSAETKNAAQVAGVNVPATLIRIYVLAAILYALGGFLLGAKAGGASTATGFGYELEAIAACTIGGVSTNGGVGKVSGVLIRTGI